MSLDDAIIEAIGATLAHCRGNKTRAAKRLQISVRCLRNWVNKEPRLQNFRGRKSVAAKVQASKRYDLLYPDK